MVPVIPEEPEPEATWDTFIGHLDAEGYVRIPCQHCGVWHRCKTEPGLAPWSVENLSKFRPVGTSKKEWARTHPGELAVSPDPWRDEWAVRFGYLAEVAPAYALYSTNRQEP